MLLWLHFHFKLKGLYAGWTFWCLCFPVMQRCARFPCDPRVSVVQFFLCVRSAQDESLLLTQRGSLVPSAQAVATCAVTFGGCPSVPRGPRRQGLLVPDSQSVYNWAKDAAFYKRQANNIRPVLNRGRMSPARAPSLALEKQYSHPLGARYNSTWAS